MTDFPMTEDVVLLNAGDTQRKGMYVEFGLFPTPDGIDPNGRNPFMDMKGGREHGQRFRVTFHLLGENEETTDTGAAEPADEPAPEPAQTPEEPAPRTLALKERRPWEEVSASQQSGIRCNEDVFQTWLWNTYPDVWRACVGAGDRQDVAAGCVRWICGRLTSRSELDKPENHTARNMWVQLDGHYRAAQHGQSDPDMARMADAGPG